MRVQPAGVEAELKDPADSGRRCCRRRSCRSSTSSRSSTPDGSTFTMRDPYAFLPTLGELDLHLVERGAARGAVRAARRARARDRRRQRHRVRGVGAERALGRRRRRLQLAGTAGCTRCARSARPGSGSSSSRRRRRARSTSSRSARRTDGCASRPTRSRSRPRCRRRTRPSSYRSTHEWTDDEWLAARAKVDPLRSPISIYEVHLGSWRRNTLEGNRPLDVPRARRRARRLRRRISGSRTSS